MRLSKLVWATVGAAALVAVRPAAACGGSGIRCGCHWEPAVTWYAPNSPYPDYFIPPYPATSYLPVNYPGSSAETGIAVRNQLAVMGIPSLVPLPRPKAEKDEDNTPPKPGAKNPPKGGDKLPDLPGDR